MIAIGCLAPLILAVVGGLLGHLAAGYPGIPWGLGIGFGLGSAILAGFAWVTRKMKS
ncbi:hypothetical protein [Amorphus coralli]|uniref:hypothetical protein n=1 Tax=Amorphus coralli TaxID=340680 RepID=UPI000379DAB4|nr:hypothetical protein [Amorphus coralli]